MQTARSAQLGSSSRNSSSNNSNSRPPRLLRSREAARARPLLQQQQQRLSPALQDGAATAAMVTAARRQAGTARSPARLPRRTRRTALSCKRRRCSQIHLRQSACRPHRAYKLQICRLAGSLGGDRMLSVHAVYPFVSA